MCLLQIVYHENLPPCILRGVPMKELVCSCSVGKVEDTILMDLDGPEDMYGQVDLAVATIGNQDKFVLVQICISN